MEIYALCGLKRVSLFVIVLAVAGKIAAADPLYTVTDRGSASQPSSAVTYSTDAYGEQIATINDSTSIPYPQAPPLFPAPQSGPTMQVLAGSDQNLSPPMMQETTGFVSDYNNSGIVLGSINTGRDGIPYYNIYYAELNTNGTYQNLGPLNPPSPVQYEPDRSGNSLERRSVVRTTKGTSSSSRTQSVRPFCRLGRRSTCF